MSAFRAAALAAALSLPLVCLQQSDVAADSFKAGTSVIGTCQPTKVTFRASIGGTTTSSNTFVNVGGTRIKFRQRGNKPTCVIVEFSAMWNAIDNRLLVVRAYLDNTTAGLPNNQAFATSTDVYQVRRSTNFIFPEVAPGTHVLKIQFSNGGTAGDVTLQQPNTIVHYAP